MTDSLEHTETRAFRGATFLRCDLAGATFRECDLRGVRIVGSYVPGLVVTGFDGEAGQVFVDDVDVSGFVAGQLDRRFPERVVVRTATTLDELRAAWTAVSGLWAAMVAEVGQDPATAEVGVAGEWSFVETLRHLVFAIDTWIGRMVLGGPVHGAYHRLGLPPTDFAPADADAMGLDLAAEVGLQEAAELHAARAAIVTEVLAGLDEADLGRARSAALSPSEEPTTETLAQCVRIVLREHVEHRRFARRDLDLVRARPPRS